MGPGPLALLFIPWIDYLIGGGCSGQRIYLAQGEESFTHLAGTHLSCSLPDPSCPPSHLAEITCARTHLSWSLLDPMAALSPRLPPLSLFLREKPFSLILVCLMNVSPGPGDAPTYLQLGWIGKHLELAQETQDWNPQTHLENFGGVESTSPPRWLLHHVALITCTCQNLLECSFTCWEIPAAAAEGLELPFQGPGFGNVPICDPSPFQVGSVHPGDPGPIPAGSEPCRCAQVSLNVTWPCPT